MEQKNNLGDVVFMVALILFAVVLVDERWVRTAIALVPALLLAQRALARPGGPPARVGAAAPVPRDRRADTGTRDHVQRLLKHFREFYTTCHLMAGGKLDPQEARELAGGIERELNKLLAEVTEMAQSRARAGGG